MKTAKLLLAGLTICASAFSSCQKQEGLKVYDKSTGTLRRLTAYLNNSSTLGDNTLNIQAEINKDKQTDNVEIKLGFGANGFCMVNFGTRNFVKENLTFIGKKDKFLIYRRETAETATMITYRNNLTGEYQVLSEHVPVPADIFVDPGDSKGNVEEIRDELYTTLRNADTNKLVPLN